MVGREGAPEQLLLSAEVRAAETSTAAVVATASEETSARAGVRCVELVAAAELGFSVMEVLVVTVSLLFVVFWVFLWIFRV